MGDDAPHPKYIISNSDEMEPGAFKDRLLMEGNPHQLIEGLIIGAYAIQADVAYIFLRWEYNRSAERLGRAIEEAYAAGLPGQKHPGHRLQPRDAAPHERRPLHLRRRDGASQRPGGKAGHPPLQAPLPAALRALGKAGHREQRRDALATCPTSSPTAPPGIKGLSRCADGGTKIYGVSGRVKRPGAWELPMGTTDPGNTGGTRRRA